MPDMPIIMLTAKGLELEEARLRDAYGVRHLVFKPFSPADLVTLVKECLGRTVLA
jgi:DNA-binding response OmpR family regulator